MNSRIAKWGVLLGLGMVCPLSAQTVTNFTWTKIDRNGNWGNPANWDGPVSREPDSPGHRAIFGNPAGMGMPIQNHSMPHGLGQLVFSNSGWTVYYDGDEGNALLFDSTSYFQYNAIHLYSSGQVTIAAPIEFLTAGQNIHVSAGSLLVLGLGGTGGVAGTIAPIVASHHPTADDPGAVRVDAAGTTTAPWTLRGGALLVRHSSALGTSPVRIGDGYSTDGSVTWLLLDAAGVTLPSPVVVTSIANRQITATLGASHGPGSSTFSGAITALRPIRLTASNAASTVTFSGAISGTGSVTKTGPGTVILAGANDFLAPLQVQEGKLQLAASGALPNGVTVTLANAAGTLLELGASATIGWLGGGGAAGGNLKSTSGTLSLRAGDFAGRIEASGPVAKSGAATLSLSGNNAWPELIVHAGTVRLDSALALPSGSTVTLADVEGALLNLNGQSAWLGSLRGGGVSGGQVALGGGALAVNGGLFTGAVVGVGTVIKTNADLFALAGASSWTGSLRVLGGTVRLDASGALPTASTVELANVSGALLNLSGHTQTVAAIEGGGANGGHVALGGGRLTIFSGSYTGAIYGSGGLVKTGPGLLVLAGSNTWAGSLHIEEGTVRKGAAAALPTGVVATLAAGGSAVLDLHGHSQQLAALNGGGQVWLGAGTLSVNSGQYAGVISGEGALVKTGGDVLRLAGSNAYAGGTTIMGGRLEVRSDSALPPGGNVLLLNAAGVTLDIGGRTVTVGTLNGGGGAGGTVTLDGGTLTAKEGSFFGAVRGAGQVWKTGEGTLSFWGANEWTGALVVEAGTLKVAAQSALPPGLRVTVSNAATATLDLSGTPDPVVAELTGGGAAGGRVELGAGRLSVSRGDFGGQITGDGGLTKVGRDTLVLRGDNTFLGATRIEGGTLQLGDGGVRGWLTSDIENNGVLEIRRSDSVALTQALIGTGTLRKRGVGTLALNGLVEMAGTVEVIEGTLTLNGHHYAAADYVVHGIAGGRLEGAGRIEGSVDVRVGAYLAPGSSVGTLQVGQNATLHGTLEIELGAGGAADLLEVGGRLEIGGASVEFRALEPPTAAAYVFARYGQLVGEFAEVRDLPPGYWIDYNYQGGSQIALVPEPSAAILIALAAVLRVFRRRSVPPPC